MKRKTKQKKLNVSSTGPFPNTFDLAAKSDGPRTRSSNESQEHSKPRLSYSLEEEDSGGTLRTRFGHSVLDSTAAGLISGTSKSSRGRRLKVATAATEPALSESRPCSLSDNPITPPPEYKGLELPPSITQDYEQEDSGAPELVAVHDASVSSTPSTFVEPRHFVDKSDVNTSHNQRRLNKRELKALLKQTKKARTSVDENVLAMMEQLADRMKDSCAIDLNPTTPKPIRIASPPTPTKRGRGRKARGGRRGGAKSTTDTTEQPCSIPASWIPLILPSQMPCAGHSSSDPDPRWLHFKPWLNEISEARLHRFAVSVKHVLSQHFFPEATVTSCTVVNSDTTSHGTLVSVGHSSAHVTLAQPHTPTNSVTQVPATGTTLSTCTAHLMSNYSVSSSSQLDLKNPSTEALNNTFVTSNPIMAVSQAELKDVATNSYPYIAPTSRPRGRGRGRGRGRRFPLSTTLSRGTCLRGGHQPSATNTIPLPTTAKMFHSSRGPNPTKTNPRVPRELRGLVTWDAVMAQQRRQQEQGQLGIDSTAANALLAVAQDMLVAAAVDEDGVPLRTRRTRQSSGSALSQSGRSTFHSDSGSAITASGSTTLEVNHRPKIVDVSSIARSGISTESSSVSSELFNSNTQIFDQAEEPSEEKPLTQVSSQTTKLEHKELDVHGEPEITAQQTPLCSEPTATLGPVKYSPISTDQEPDLSHTADADMLPEKSCELMIEVQKPTSSCKRRGRKQKHLTQATHSVDSTPTVSCGKQDSSVGASSSEIPLSPELLTSCTSTAIIGKRRRQPLHCLIASETPTHTNPGDSDDWNGLRSPDEAVPDFAETSTSVGPRRATGSRNATLPPRKRYKVGIDSSTSAIQSSTHLTRDSSEDVPPDTASEQQSVGIPVASRKLNPVADLTTVTSLPSHLPPSTSVVSIKKRGRGRPSRRGALRGATRVTAVFSMHSPISQNEVSLLSDRPKREAAAIGFASLVAANLNNSTAQAGSATSMDSPTRRPANNDSASSGAQPTSDTLHDTNRATLFVPTTPRGRGRPPRSKIAATMLKSAESGLHSTNVIEASCETSTAMRRKRSTIVCSLDKSTYPDGHHDGRCSRGQSDITNHSTIEISSKKLSCLTSPMGVRKKTTQRMETGDVPAETPTEVPWSVFVDQLSNRSLTPSRNGESQKGVSDFDSVHTEKSTDPSYEPGRPRSPVHGRKGRPRVQGRSHVSKPSELSLSCPEPSIRPSSASTLANLPGRANLFKGNSINDSILLGTNPEAPCKGPLCDILLRFLNERDPSDPNCRLVAPIVYLPAPERNPDFFRFVISSYSCGSGFRIRFSDDLLHRLFTASSNNSIQQDAATDKAEEGVFDVEFPSLCLASIARRLYDQASLQNNGGDLADWLHAPNGLTDSELACVPLDANDTENCLPLLDAAVESLLTVWESFAGRRSWLGRRLVRLRGVYSAVRSECAISIANDYGLLVPPLKATAVLNLPYYKPLGPGTKKKSDRRALERGAEVIRCLCGFRVEGGHVMVQCDHCAAWQHLPCLWWALNQAISSPTVSPSVKSLCEAALLAAQAAGSGYLSEIVGPGTSGSIGKFDGSEPPYFCPVCLNLRELTLEYPRSLSAAMATNNISSVFSLQETVVEGEHEFWSLSSPDGLHQIRTDDYAFINRTWLQFCQSPTSFSAAKGADAKQADLGLAAAEAKPITCAYDRLIIRIYRLWKDTSGTPWLEGGLFLRPYDVVQLEDSSSDQNFSQCRLWHHREVIYDEASRLVLPLTAWHGRCVVLCPSAYRTGRPAELLSAEEAKRFLKSDGITTEPSFAYTSESNAPDVLEQLFFVCDKLFERTPGSGAIGYRFDEISPGYLKVNMRPYCFFRKPDVPGFGRPNLQRQFTASKLLEFDRANSITYNQQNGGEINSITLCSPEVTVPNVLSSEQPKGAKLAKLVAWLERKREQDGKANTCKGLIEQVHTSADIAFDSSSSTNQVITSGTARSPSGRGRPPRGSRGRGRPPRNSLIAPSTVSRTEVSADLLIQSTSAPYISEANKLLTQSVQPKPQPTALTNATSDTNIIPQVYSNLPNTTALNQPSQTSSLLKIDHLHPIGGHSNQTSSFDTEVFKSVDKPSPTEINTSANVNISSTARDCREFFSMNSSHPGYTQFPGCDPHTSSLAPSILLEPVVIEEKSSSRRKRTHLRKRTTSEPRLSPASLVISCDAPRFLSDSETAEATNPMSQTTEKTTTQLSCHTRLSPLNHVEVTEAERNSSPSTMIDITICEPGLWVQNNCVVAVDKSSVPASSQMENVSNVATDTVNVFGDPDEIPTKRRCLVSDESQLPTCESDSISQSMVEKIGSTTCDHDHTEADTSEYIGLQGKMCSEELLEFRRSDLERSLPPNPVGADVLHSPSLNEPTESPLVEDPISSPATPTLTHHTTNALRTELSPTASIYSDLGQNSSTHSLSTSSSTSQAVVTTTQSITANVDVTSTQTVESIENLELKCKSESCKSGAQSKQMHNEGVTDVDLQLTDLHATHTEVSVTPETSEAIAESTVQHDVTELVDISLEGHVSSDPLMSEVADSNATPILDEPGENCRFDGRVGSGSIESRIMGCLSDTVNALLFHSQEPITGTTDCSDRFERDAPEKAPSIDPSFLCPRHAEDSGNEISVTYSHTVSKTSRSESRHGSAHSDYLRKRHQSHKSSRHHHKHHDRDRRSRSPASPPQCSSSSDGGINRTHPHCSPFYRDEGGRKEHSRDYNHHRSPSNSSRSSTSSSYRHSHYPYHHHHHYRHHSRKQSSRPREVSSSSLPPDPERSAVHQSNNDQDQTTEVRHA